MKSLILKLPLLAKVLLSIILGVLLGFVMPEWCARIFITINSLFSNFLGFIIPLLIVGLVAPGIADLGKGAGKLLFITAIIAYGFTLFSGFLTYFSCDAFLPSLLSGGDLVDLSSSSKTVLQPYISIVIPPMFDVTTALVLAFTLGIGITFVEGDRLKGFMDEFRQVIVKTINSVIIPLLPLYIFGIFMNITLSGEVAGVISVFVKLIVVIFIMTIVLLFVQFGIAALVSKTNPFKALKNMLPAYVTALGTQSSAATIPVTLKQSIKNGVNEDVAGFVIPLAATIHLSGSTMKIVACAMAIMLMSGSSYDIELFATFITMLGITMVAAPGVPGGAIMAALGLLSSILLFDENMQALMIALYIAMDSFGTATNVTGDGAIALIVDKIRNNYNEKQPH